jgi:hypothetical protein
MTPMRRPLPWIIAVVLCVGIAGITWWKRPAPVVATPVVPAAVAEPVAARPTTRTASSVARVPIDPSQPFSDPARRELQARVDRTRETFTARYNDERVDSAWSNAMERDLVALSDSEQMRAMDANVSNLEVDCRTTMCRIRGEVASITAGDDWITLYMTNVGAKLPEVTYHYVPGDDGKLRIELFAIGRR